MASNLVKITGSLPTAAITPADEQALRSIAYSVRAGEDDADIRRRITPAVANAIAVRIAETAAALAPATRGDARRYLGPTLSLVAPAGMTAEDQTAWLAAALDTLGGIPADLLEAGCRAARAKVDHPAKIVAAILAAVGTTWDRRKADHAGALRLERVAQLPAPDVAPVATPEQAAEALGALSIHAAPPAERRAPTIADYVAHGLTEAEAVELVAQQQAA